MGGRRISFTFPVFIFQNCKAKGGEVPYFQFIFFRGPFKARVGHEKGEKHLFSPQATVVTVLWGFPPHGLGNVGGKKSLFQHFLSVAPGCAVPLLITGQHVTAACSCMTCRDPVGQMQRTEEARMKCVVWINMWSSTQ